MHGLLNKGLCLLKYGKGKTFTDPNLSTNCIVDIASSEAEDMLKEKDELKAAAYKLC